MLSALLLKRDNNVLLQCLRASNTNANQWRVRMLRNNKGLYNRFVRLLHSRLKHSASRHSLGHGSMLQTMNDVSCSKPATLRVPCQCTVLGPPYCSRLLACAHLLRKPHNQQAPPHAELKSKCLHLPSQFLTPLPTHAVGDTRCTTSLSTTIRTLAAIQGPGSQPLFSTRCNSQAC